VSQTVVMNGDCNTRFTVSTVSAAVLMNRRTENLQWTSTGCSQQWITSCSSGAMSITGKQSVYKVTQVGKVTTLLEFLETWNCLAIWLRSGKRTKVRERSANLC